MNALLLAGLAPLLPATELATTAPVELRFRPAEGLELTFSHACDTALELVESSSRVSTDGRDAKHRPNDVQHERHISRAFEFTDRVVRMDDGRPTRIDREFGVLEDTEEFETTHSRSGARTNVTRLRSPLANRTVRFDWDAGDYTPSGIDEEIDPDELKWARANADLADLLPTGPVEIGDTWEPDEGALLRVLYPAGPLALRSDDPGPIASVRQVEPLANADPIRCTLETVRDGVAEIAIRLVGTGRTESVAEHGPLSTLINGEITIRRETSFELEGELHWDVERNIPVAIFLDGEVEQRETIDQDSNTADGTLEIDTERRWNGTFELSTGVSIEK